jgi:hypothetical protein
VYANLSREFLSQNQSSGGIARHLRNTYRLRYKTSREGETSFLDTGISSVSLPDNTLTSKYAPIYGLTVPQWLSRLPPHRSLQSQRM